MPNQATAAQLRGPIPTTPDLPAEPLVLTEEEHDTLAWVLMEAHTTAATAPADADDELGRVILAMHAAWVGPIFHTPRFAVDGTVVVDPPVQVVQRRALGRLLRMLGTAALPNAHPTGTVFYVTARQAVALADRIEHGEVTS